MAQHALANNHRNYIDTRFSDAIAADRRLSTSAKALGWVLASLGDGAPVTTTAQELKDFCGFRTDVTLLAARRELERHGYVSTERKSGRILRYILTVAGEVLQ